MATRAYERIVCDIINHFGDRATISWDFADVQPIRINHGPIDWATIRSELIGVQWRPPSVVLKSTLPAW